MPICVYIFGNFLSFGFVSEMRQYYITMPINVILLIAHVTKMLKTKNPNLI